MNTLQNLNLDELFSNGQWEVVKNQFKEALAENYRIRKDTITVICDGVEHEMSVGLAFINLLLFRSFSDLGVSPTESDLFIEKNVTQDTLDKYFGYIIERFRAEDVNADYDKIRQSIIETMNELCDLSGEYNIKVGNSISYRDLIRLEAEDKDFYDMTHYKLQPGQFSEIEQQFNDLCNKLIKYFKNKTDAELHPFATSGTGINKKQFGQCFGVIGLKPTMSGGIIHKAISDNFFRGLSTPESYYTNALGTRKALVTNAKYTKKSGYLTRKLELSNIDHYHDDSIKDCGTAHFVIFSVDNQRKLRQINGRHYYDLDDSLNKVSELKTAHAGDTFLIGKKIGLRSPVTCCGKHVCATCYGRELSAVNKDINTGIVGVNTMTNPLTQMLLSAKHLLTTKAEAIKWSDEFREVFSLNMDSAYIRDTSPYTVSFVVNADNYDEDEDAYFVNTIELVGSGAKKNITYEAPTKLFINPALIPDDLASEAEVSVAPKSFESTDQYVFKYQIKNAELTQSLQQILDLIETTDHLGITNYHDLVNKFDDLLILNGLDYINSVHVEMIAATLIKNAETKERLDFSKAVLDDYVINRVSKTVMEAPLAVSLSFERINEQLIDLNTFKKTDDSYMDYLFM